MLYTKNLKKDHEKMNVSVSETGLKCGHRIEPIIFSDLDEFVRLHDKYLNYGEGVRPHFEKVLKDERTIAIKYMIDGEMAGATVFTVGIAFSGGHPDLCDEMDKLTGGQLTYTADALFVREKYQHLGVSQGLFSLVAEELRDRDVRFVVNELWIHPDGTQPARDIIKAFGEIAYQKEHKNFYMDFYQYGYLCPICGKDCICGAQVNLSKVV